LTPIDRPARRRLGRLLRIPLLSASLLATAACGGDGASPLRIGSTTSLYDSGLLDELVPAFERAHPEQAVRVIAVGTGEALALGRRRDVDLLLVHAPSAEAEFIEGGYGHDRVTFMRNDFVLAGPALDPAGIGGAGTATEALAAIAEAEAPFISRGDGSGTHIKETALWSSANIAPEGQWYQEVGQGMGATLQIASERQAYVLTDRATLLSLGDNLELDILFADDSALENLYSVIRVTGAANAGGACAFATWILSPDARRLITEFRRDTLGSGPFRVLPVDPATAGLKCGTVESVR